MSQVPILPPTPYLITKLRYLVQRAACLTNKTLSLSFQASCPKISELYTSIEPEQVLLDLIDKAKTFQSRKNWKQDQTSYLIYIIDRYSQAESLHPKNFDFSDWDQIAGYLPGRTVQSCRFRFLSLAPSSITDTPWEVEERQLLIRIIQIQQNTNINWKIVSQKLYQLNPNKIYRTGKQCRQHYTCFLRPNLKKGPWTDSEDYQLICLFMSYGKKWSKMAKFIEGRNQNSIKNRFFLMFENKKQGRLTNSDLTKLVKRKKEKLEKKMTKSQEQQTIEQNAANNLSLQERNQIQIEYLGGEENIEQNQNVFEEYESLFNSQVGKQWVSSKKETFMGTSSEQIQKYINF